MEYSRSEIMNGVWLTHLRTDKFKTACISVTLLTQLRRETAAMNALIPLVLRRGTALCGDMEAISRRLDELYGAAVEPVVRRIGEIQCLGFIASAPEDEMLPEGSRVLEGECSLLGQLLLSPKTRGGLLKPEYVDSEREKLVDLIRSRVNDKLSYSLQRCIEEMCCCEDYAVGRLGDEESAEAIRYQKLTKQYRELIRTSPIEIFYCGRADRRRVEGLMRDALATAPRGEIDEDIGTDVRMNALEDKPRVRREEMAVSQGKLVVGWRLGECMEEPDPAALRVFVSLYGGSAMSKLFVNVREKLSLCYYASAIADIHKGTLFAYAGTEFADAERAADEIVAQLESVARGEISPEELQAAKSDVISALRSSLDSQVDLEGFFLSAAVDGLELQPEELCALVEDVTAEDVAAIAAGCECDMIYFLTGSGEEDGGGGGEAEELSDTDGLLSEEAESEDGENDI